MKIRKLVILPLMLIILSGSVNEVQAKITLGTLFRQQFYRFKTWVRYEVGHLRNFSTGGSKVKQQVHVLGFEPSWLMRDSLYVRYPFEMLTDLAIGEYDVNPKTGLPRNNMLRDTMHTRLIIEKALEQNSDINILLSVTMYGDYRQKPFFLNDEAITNLINNLDGQLQKINEMRNDGGAMQNIGIMLDFQNVPNKNKGKFAQFLERLQRDLNNEASSKSALIYLVLPFEDKEKIWQDGTLTNKARANVDLFIIRGHRFDEMEYSGPMVPHEVDSGWSVDSAVHYYNRNFKNTPQERWTIRDRAIIEFPYFGMAWDPDGKVYHKRPLYPISDIMNIVKLDTNGAYHDSLNRGAVFATDSCTYWFEDTVTLDFKYGWVKKQKLSGIAVFGLGYAQGMDGAVEQAMWDAIGKHFGETPPRLFFPGIAFLLTFLIAGVFWSAIHHWQVRFALNENRKRILYYIGLILAMIVGVIICYIDIKVVSLKWKIIILIVILMFPLGSKIAGLLKVVK